MLTHTFSIRFFYFFKVDISFRYIFHTQSFKFRDLSGRNSILFALIMHTNFHFFFYLLYVILNVKFLHQINYNNMTMGFYKFLGGRWEQEMRDRFSMGIMSGEFAGQSSTPTPGSFNQLLVLLAVRPGAKFCWKMKSASLTSWSAEGSIKCSKISW